MNNEKFYIINLSQPTVSTNNKIGQLMCCNDSSVLGFILSVMEKNTDIIQTDICHYDAWSGMFLILFRFRYLEVSMSDTQANEQAYEFKNKHIYSCGLVFVRYAVYMQKYKFNSYSVSSIHTNTFKPKPILSSKLKPPISLKHVFKF